MINVLVMSYAVAECKQIWILKWTITLEFDFFLFVAVIGRRVHLCDLNFYYTWNMSPTHAKNFISYFTVFRRIVFCFVLFFSSCLRCAVVAHRVHYSLTKNDSPPTMMTNTMVFITIQFRTMHIDLENSLNYLYFFSSISRKEMAFVNTTRSSSICWRGWTASGYSHDGTSELQVPTTSSKAHKISNWCRQYKSANHQQSINRFTKCKTSSNSIHFLKFQIAMQAF